MNLSHRLQHWLARTACLTTLVMSSLLAACAFGPKVAVNPDAPPMVAGQPLNGHVRFISVDDKEVDLCNGCEGRVGNPGYFSGLFGRMIQSYLPVRVSNLLVNGKAVDRSTARPLEMRAKLKQFHVELEFGITKIYLLTEYKLSEKGNVIGTWVVPSYGVSDSLAIQDSSYEAMLNAIDNNAASFYLRFITDSSPSDADQASKALAAVDTRMKEEMNQSGNPVWAAASWTAVTVVKGIP